MYIYNYISLSFSQNEKYFRQNVVEKIKTHILCSITAFRKSCPLQESVEKYGRSRKATDDNIIQHIRIALWTPEATDTNSEYEKLTAFPLQKWLQERASMLRLYETCVPRQKAVLLQVLPYVLLQSPRVNEEGTEGHKMCTTALDNGLFLNLQNVTKSERSACNRCNKLNPFLIIKPTRCPNFLNLFLE